MIRKTQFTETKNQSKLAGHGEIDNIDIWFDIDK